ncbi:MAG: hypothetical protein JNL42_18365 [Anaerolineae bacterium]|nr:hypothetical protein [Anaerolineae bacterium]
MRFSLHLTAFFLVTLVCCAACAPNDVVPDAPIVRGSTLTLAQVPQADPPAFAVSGDHVLAFWIGSDDRGVHHDARIARRDAAEPALTLPLPPVHPFAQTAVNSTNGAALLFWLDENPDTPERAALYAARIGADLRVERGPVAVSDTPVYDYTAQTDGEGGAWIVWSGGAAAEPVLYARQIDRDGRPLEPGRVGASGTAPALTYDAQGRRWLFWLANGQVWRGAFSRGQIDGEPEALTAAIQMDPGDRLTGLAAGSDGRLGYVFWNVARRDGENETWLVVGSFNDPYWAQPRLLTNASGAPARFATPLDQPASPLPIAVVDADGITLRFGVDGLLGESYLVLSPAELLRAPLLKAQPDGELLLAWAAPSGETASLNLLRLSR